MVGDYAVHCCPSETFKPLQWGAMVLCSLQLQKLSAFPLSSVSAVVSLPLLPQWQFKVLAATAISLKCTLQFKPAHQSRASSAVTVASNICTTKERLADSSTPPHFTPFPFHSDSSSTAFVLGPKIPIYPCDPPPLCTNLLELIGLPASVLPLTAPRPLSPCTPQDTHRSLPSCAGPPPPPLPLPCMDEAWITMTTHGCTRCNFGSGTVNSNDNRMSIIQETQGNCFGASSSPEIDVHSMEQYQLIKIIIYSHVMCFAFISMIP